MSARKFDTNTARTPSFFDSTTYLYGWKTSEPAATQDFKVLWDDAVDAIRGGFTSGSVIYADSSGVLAEDNAGLFYDDIQGFLGVGINTPTETLSIGNGAGTITATIASDGFMHLAKTSSTIGSNQLILGNQYGRVKFTANGNSFIDSHESNATLAAGLRFVSRNSIWVFGGVFAGVYNYNSFWFEDDGVNAKIGTYQNVSRNLVLYTGTQSGDLMRFFVANGERYRFSREGFQIFNNTIPTTTNADSLKIYSRDLSAGNTMLGLRTEGTPIGGGTPTATNTLAIEVNGTTYYLLASTSAT